MFPPFPVEEAHAVCLAMTEQLDDGILILEQLPVADCARNGHGVMLGALLCRAPDGRRVTLKTVSGIRNALRPADGLSDPNSVYVPPVAAAKKIDAALRKNDARIHDLTAQIMALKEQRRRLMFSGRASEPCGDERALLAARKALTDESLRAVYALYSFCCADGKTRTLSEICGKKLPPTGTGDCCAPKLLHYAFRHGLTPLSMDEVFYGTPPDGGLSPRTRGPYTRGNHGAAENSGGRCIPPAPTPQSAPPDGPRGHRGTPEPETGASRPPCDGRCALILPAMLGLEILYRDRDIIVVNKESGVLSVPGRGPEKQDCVASRVRRLFPDCIAQPAVHRLDMETSGLMVLAFTEEAHRALCRQFERGEVRKQYTALLEGPLAAARGQSAPRRGEKSGRMELYFRTDIENRPHQIWDETYGKKAVTEWQDEGVLPFRFSDGTRRNVTRVLFTPRTGRTHQLRLAAADPHGFALPIIGDSLYGTPSEAERLMLHARYISFVHPASGERMEFFSEPEF